jgi:hypothetical protein
MANPEAALRRLVMAIAVGDAAEFSKMLGASPDLATACFEVANATRRATKQNFVAQLGKYIYRGDTALHFAAAAYAPQMLKQLVKAGANARAKNRLGDEPLHAAACGNPDASHWNPGAQAEIIVALINAGADPGAMNKMGVAPLHKALCRSRASTPWPWSRSRTKEPERLRSDVAGPLEHGPRRKRLATSKSSTG